MLDKPLVSCIIIFFNAQKFFEEAIESVFSQTYENWELLLVDDGSADGSTEIAQYYAQKYPEKVHFLQHEGHQNRGMSATRNLGVRHAKGDYIAFLDSDDAWLPHKLEQQVKFMQSYPDAGMIYGKSLYWKSWTGKPEDQVKDYVPDNYVQANKLYEPLTLLTQCYPLGTATPPPPTDIMLRREVVINLGGFEEGFKKEYQLYEDQAFFAKLYLRFSVFVAEECWDKYRLHSDSCSSNVAASGRYGHVRLFFLNWLKQYLQDQGIQDREVWNTLERELLQRHHSISDCLKKLIQAMFYQAKRLTKTLANYVHLFFKLFLLNIKN